MRPKTHRSVREDNIEKTPGVRVSILFSLSFLKNQRRKPVADAEETREVKIGIRIQIDRCIG